ncbi:MAG: superoxide dismutase family protein [Labilithrix sp.]|nr:superoxide dismutase family protein [Labilithrix sp.]MBX3223185.1 superoxide dismutase family protein [Labilithrix sp.]
MAIAGACKNSDPEDASAARPLGSAMLPPPMMPEAAAPPGRTDTDGWLLVDPGAAEPKLVSQAVVTLQPTKGNKAAGTVRLIAMTDGVKIKVAFSGLTFLAKYTIRVHLLGDCSSEDGSGAGPGFNFGGSSLDPPNPGGPMGNLGELQADVSGEAKGEGKVDQPSLQGTYSIVGRSIVLHATSNDPAQAGAEGPRIACGVIGVFAD